MITIKHTFGTRTFMPASVTDLGCIYRIDTDYLDTEPFGFVPNKRLQLIKTPVTYPVINRLSSVNFSYSFKVFHHDFASLGSRYNLFTDVMVYPSHEPFFPTRNFPKKVFAGTGAFGLKPATQISKLSFNLLCSRRFVKYIIGSNCKIVNPQIDAETFPCLDRLNMLREREQEKASTLLVKIKQAFLHLPVKVVKISLITGWYSERHFYPSLVSGKAKNIILDRRGTGKVIPDTSLFYDWLSFTKFNHPARLLGASDSKLGMQAKGSKIRVHDVMKFNIIFNLHFPSSINTVLQPLRICFDSFDYLTCWLYFHLSSGSYLHSNYETRNKYKTIVLKNLRMEFKEKKQKEDGIPPTSKKWVSCLKLYEI